MQKIIVKYVKLRNVGPFKEFELHLDPSYNLICGTNGIGKTSILNSIAGLFNGGWNAEFVRKNSRATEDGELQFKLDIDGSELLHTGKVKTFLPDESQTPFGLYNEAANVIFLNKDRDFKYQKLESISSDATRNPLENMNFAQRGINFSDIKEWFVKRYLFEPHKDNWPADHIENLALAKKCFSLLDPGFELSHAHHATFEIFVKTPSGVVPIEYLSSGFRASLALLLGIIKEVEIRRLGVSAENFSGIILIDELDMHLHPTWQKTFPLSLKNAFPNAQLIVTTHSPHMIQSSEAHEVIALVQDDSGAPQRADLTSSTYGFKGWTVEEILEDVMGMRDTNSSEFNTVMNEFESAISADDPDRTLGAIKTLELMLHPESPYRKLIKIQAAPVVGAVK